MAKVVFQEKKICAMLFLAQLCLTLCDPIDCSPPDSSVHGDSPGKNTGVGCCALLQGIFLTQRLNPHLWEHPRLTAPQLSVSVVKNPPAYARDMGSIPGLGRSPGGGHDNPHQYACLKNPRGQRSLAGCRPWGHKELGTTERQQNMSVPQRLC